MKSIFSQSALVFPQFWVFEATFEARGQNLLIFKNSVCTFYCTQNDCLFNAKIGLKHGPPWAEILAKMFLNMAHQTKPQPHFVFFSNISTQGGPFFKPIFALKPWD